MAVIVPYFGEKLPGGTHNAYHREIITLIDQYTAAALHIEALFQLYKEAVELQRSLTRKVSASSYTTDIVKGNELCDLWIRTFIAVQKAYMIAPVGSDTRKHAEALKPIAQAYDGIHRQEQSKQTTETQSMLEKIRSNETIQAAITALGLDIVISSLEEENERLEENIRLRNREEAERKILFGDNTATKQRTVVNDLYKQIVERVNAYAIVEPTEAIENFIVHVTATAEYYANIAARDNKANKPNLSPETKPNPDESKEEDKTEEEDPNDGGSPAVV